MKELVEELVETGLWRWPEAGPMLQEALTLAGDLRGHPTLVHDVSELMSLLVAINRPLVDLAAPGVAEAEAHGDAHVASILKALAAMLRTVEEDVAQGVETLRAWADDTHAGEPALRNGVESAEATVGKAEAQAGGDSAPLAQLPAVLRAGSAVRFLSTLLFSGQPSHAHATLLRQREALVFLQGVREPSLQQLRTVAFETCRMLAALPLYAPEDIAQATAALSTLAASPMRMVAVHALGHAHLVAWKHCLGGTPAATTTAVRMAEAALSDTRPDVQKAATQCLAGLLRLLSPQQHQEMRARLLSRAEQLRQLTAGFKGQGKGEPARGTWPGT